MTTSNKLSNLHLDEKRVTSFLNAVDYYNELHPDDRETFREYVDSYAERGRLLDQVAMRCKEWTEEKVNDGTAMRMINGWIAQYWEKK